MLSLVNVRNAHIRLIIALIAIHIVVGFGGSGCHQRPCILIGLFGIFGVVVVAVAVEELTHEYDHWPGVSVPCEERVLGFNLGKGGKATLIRLTVFL